MSNLKNMKLVIGNDHAGVDFKNQIITHLETLESSFHDIGVKDTTSVDYPDIAYSLCEKIIKGEADCGILICGTGIGMSIAANRFSEIRAALCHDVTSARLAREHNNANILILGARMLGSEVTKDIIDTFLKTDYLAGRHENRVQKLKLEGVLKL
jgi:ribose 5-phosphate isomerase B